jgi:hypothetical protein
MLSLNTQFWQDFSPHRKNLLVSISLILNTEEDFSKLPKGLKLRVDWLIFLCNFSPSHFINTALQAFSLLRHYALTFPLLMLLFYARLERIFSFFLEISCEENLCDIQKNYFQPTLSNAFLTSNDVIELH